MGGDDAAGGLPQSAARSAGPRPGRAWPHRSSPWAEGPRARRPQDRVARACGGGLRPVLTAAARGAPAEPEPAPAKAGVGTEKRPFDRTKKQHLRDTGLARVKKRDGIPGSSPRTGQPTDRGIPVTGHGATRPRGLDQTSIHATPQGLRPRAAPPGRTHDRNWSSMQTRGKILASRGPSTHDPGIPAARAPASRDLDLRGGGTRHSGSFSGLGC